MMAEDSFERAKAIAAEIEVAKATGDSQRLAELSRERRELRNQARVAAVDSEHAWSELLAINKKLGRGSARKGLSIFFWMRGGGGEHHARTGTNQVFGESESTAALRARKRELIDVLHQAGECDIDGNPLTKK